MVLAMSFAPPDPAYAGLPISAALRFLIRWTECLHGDGALRETLADFASFAQAEVVHLHRISTDTGAQRAIATFDAGAAAGKRPLTRPLGLGLVGSTLGRAKPGTLWSMTEMDPAAVERLERGNLGWMRERGFREAMVIPLSPTTEWSDVLEFYLSAPLDRKLRAEVETVAVAAALAWGRRPKGRIARILRAAPAIDTRLATRGAAHPLSDSNPLGLTAAEFRICILMLTETDLLTIGKRLGIAESTLRTHLRSIFAKAGVAGQVGLVRLLLDQDGGRAALRA